MGGKGVEYEVKVFIRGDGLHLPPPIWQKLSARRWVNFQVAYPDFGKPYIYTYIYVYMYGFPKSGYAT